MCLGYIIQQASTECLGQRPQRAALGWGLVKGTVLAIDSSCWEMFHMVCKARRLKWPKIMLFGLFKIVGCAKI